MSKWLSICSRHAVTRPDCNLCKAGYWVSDEELKFDQLLYKFSPWLFRKWANRKHSKQRARLEALFLVSGCSILETSQNR